MPDSVALPFQVSSRSHHVLGRQVCVRFADDFILRLTLKEASSLSFALVAVKDGVSPEREIYMSPIASDAAFVGLVEESGMSISTPRGPIWLDWTKVGLLAQSMAEAIGY